MKKSAAILLSFFLLISASGLSINVHYCGGEIASVLPGYLKPVKEQPIEKKGCCVEKSQDEKSCCSDKEVKIKAKYELVYKQDLAKAVFVPPAPVSFSLLTTVVEPVILEKPAYYCEPNGPPLFKLYHQFVFYA